MATTSPSQRKVREGRRGQPGKGKEQRSLPTFNMAQTPTYNGNYAIPPLQKDLDYTSDLVLPALVAFVSFGLVSEVATPVLGSVVRLQAHYSPLVRVVQTSDAQAKAVPPTRPTSIFSMIKRVKSKEGWAGLHRGLWPYLASNLIIPAVAGFIMRYSAASAPKTYQQVVGRAALRLTLISLATTILTLPFTVFINRSVAHPGQVPTSPLKAARVVLTPYERSPLVLYKAPGLLAGVFLKALWSTVVVNGLKALVAVQLLETQREGGGLWIVAFSLFQAASTYILCPLSVLIVRLSIQKQNGAPSLPSSTQEKIETVAVSSEESVITLRGDEKPPYTGLFNAYRTIREEEGAGKLYSAWGMTLFSALLETFV